MLWGKGLKTKKVKPLPKIDCLKKIKTVLGKGLKSKNKVKTPYENGLFEEKKLFGGKGLNPKKN